ncbi:ROK family transcriptional regulator [Jannaschia seohaensis]|uniref:Putative NBD/HSP70 family sugar kinase n=1 Tax=Jannaschia seohaensis TaxID=475081 RepID=A0A2Y9C0P2_9RHOB|nr:ROK family transcriptional regulator [Jannaschia seohaensis]PWJ18029.1 putative NBD/HSP70 family sugar kinase [Jannaschia seohaensis]SSA46552.1 Sugar kinase of the NBD/HSP70 family, may contain an N-terminal HTH domain [Jannaschia seohaensis]
MPDDANPMIGSVATRRDQRDYNERVLLSAIARLGAAPAAELARRTGLSAQTVSVILRALEADGLIARGAPRRGRVGKPSVPIEIAADGAFSVGLKVGRRSADLVLMDLRGEVRGQLQTAYRYPLPEDVYRFVDRALEALGRELPASARDRLCGLGLAMPFELWRWERELGAPPRGLDAWRDTDLAAEMAHRTGLETVVVNDATAACRAEAMLGRGPGVSDWAYLYVGSFIGGGVVLGGTVYEGPHGNAGAFGAMQSRTVDGRSAPLVETASLYLLEIAITGAGGDPRLLWTEPRDWSAFEPQIAPWIDETGEAIARAAVSACAVIDFAAVVVDGAVPPPIRARLVARIREVLPGLDARGLVLPKVIEGRVGENARAVGAAWAPLSARYLSIG